MLLIADTTVISNFAYANRLDLLRNIGNTCTTVEVVNNRALKDAACNYDNVVSHLAG
jgi:hypothetical protein